MHPIVWILLILVFCAVGAAGGYMYRKDMVEKKINRSEETARRLYDDAVRKADDYKKEKVFEAKELGSHTMFLADITAVTVDESIIGEDGKAVDGFSFEDCEAFAKADSTKTELRFRGGDLAALAGKPIRFRFRIHCGTLYSFWVSPSERGESRGYVAGGGPAYKGLRDL